MVKVIYLIVPIIFRKITRYFYWLYRLSKADIGRDVYIDFPIMVEGRGKLVLEDETQLRSDCYLGIGELATLVLGANSIIGKKSEIRINTNCSLIVGKKFSIGANSRLFVQNNWKFGDSVNVATNCSIFSRESDLYGCLDIGHGSRIGDNTIIDLTDNITIGRDVALGPNCTLYTHDHDYMTEGKVTWKGEINTSPILIEEGVWVGANVTILSGLKLGRNCVIAAGSVVTKDTQPNCIYGGVPAKLIKQYN